MKGCALREPFPLKYLPKGYQRNQTYGHVLHVKLENAAINKLYLTMLEQLSDTYQRSINASSMFITCVLFRNPVWDIGLQHCYMKRNSERIFTLQKRDVEKYTKKCVCPCSAYFSNWHKTTLLDKLSDFKSWIN